MIYTINLFGSVSSLHYSHVSLKKKLTHISLKTEKVSTKKSLLHKYALIQHSFKEADLTLHICIFFVL